MVNIAETLAFQLRDLWRHVPLDVDTFSRVAPGIVNSLAFHSPERALEELERLVNQFDEDKFIGALSAALGFSALTDKTRSTDQRLSDYAEYRYGKASRSARRWGEMGADFIASRISFGWLGSSSEIKVHFEQHIFPDGETDDFYMFIEFGVGDKSPMRVVVSSGSFEVDQLVEPMRSADDKQFNILSIPYGSGGTEVALSWPSDVYSGVQLETRIGSGFRATTTAFPGGLRLYVARIESDWPELP